MVEQKGHYVWKLRVAACTRAVERVVYGKIELGVTLVADGVDVRNFGSGGMEGW